MANAIIESIGKWGVVHTKNEPYFHHKRMQTPKSGDVIDFGKNKGTYPYIYGDGRIEKVEDGEVYFCCEFGSAFLREDGSVSISGGPFGRCKIKDLRPMFGTAPASFWNWGNNSSGAHQGVHYIIARPVFILEKTED